MNNRSRNIAAAILVPAVLLALVFMFDRRPIGEPTDLSPEDLRARIVAGDTTLLLLDVRTPEEYESETGHLENSLLIPVQELDRRMPELEPFRSNTIVAYCRSGRRSARAAEMLREKGFSVLNMTGGMITWNERKFPIIRKDRP